MKNKNFLTVAMLCCSTLVAFGQFDLTTNNFIEAEDWVSELNCHVNDMEGKTIKSNEGFSNKKSVQFMSGGVEYVTTYVINGIPKAGTYNLNLYMGQLKARAMQIGVNHQEYQRLSFVSEVDLSLMGLSKDVFGTKTEWGWLFPLSADWYSPEQYVLPVHLEEGTNTITMTAGRHAWYDTWFTGYVDYFTISDDAKIEVARPGNQCSVAVRSDMNEATGSFSIVEGAGLSGGKAIQLKAGEAATLNVDMPKGGVFYLDIFYCSDAERGLKVVNVSDNNREYTFVSENNKTNTGESSLEFGEDGEGNETVTSYYGMRAKRFEVTLKAGMNQLVFSPVANGDETSSPVIDMVCVNNDRPFVKPATYNLLMSDETTLSCDKGTIGLNNIKDNDESTSFVLEGQTSADITVSLNYDHILMGYRIVTSLENKDLLADMTVMGYHPTNGWVAIPLILTEDQGTYMQLASYNCKTVYGRNSNYGNNVSYSQYKITVKGVSKIDISEIQLFGFPLKNGVNDCRISGNLLQDVDDNTSRARMSTDMYQKEAGFEGMAVDRFPSNYCYSETGVLESYLEYDMVTPSAIGSYLIGIPYNIFNYSKSKFAYTTTSPRDFVMKGFSVEKNDWVVLHEMKDVDWPFMGIAYIFNTTDRTTVCSKVRLEISDNCGGYQTEIASWQAFATAKGKDFEIPVGVEDAIIFDGTVYGQNGKIVLNGVTGRYSIVDLSGRAIASGVSDGTLIEQDALSGIYIVVTEKGNKKVIVR